MATKADIIDFLTREFPQNTCVVEEVGNCSATVTHQVGTDQLRPGETVSGPLLMTVADVAIYVAILGTIGIVPLAVTTSLTINFLRKPAAGKPIVGHPGLSRAAWRRARRGVRSTVPEPAAWGRLRPAPARSAR